MKKKKIKKWLIALAIVFAVMVVLIAGMVIYMTQFDDPVVFSIENIDFTTIPDGIYLGQTDNGLVQVEVSVTVTDGRVTHIEILEHENGLGRKAEAITEVIINEQSLDVDAISSATYSSTTILKAIETALVDQREE